MNFFNEQLDLVLEGITWGPGETHLPNAKFLVDNSVPLPPEVINLIKTKDYEEIPIPDNYAEGMGNYQKPSDNEIIITANPRTALRAKKHSAPLIFHNKRNLENTIKMIENPTKDTKYSVDTSRGGLPLHPHQENVYPSSKLYSHDIPDYPGATVTLPSGEMTPTPKMQEVLNYVNDLNAQFGFEYKNIKIPEINKNIKVASVLPGTEEFQYIITNLKEESKHSNVPNIEILYDTIALYCIHLIKIYSNQGPTGKVRAIVLPESSARWASEVADRVCQDLKLAKYVYSKNKNADTIKVNNAGVQQASKSWLASKTPVVDPITRQKFTATPENVALCWHNWGRLFSVGKVSLKDMDMFVRRNNLFNLFTPDVQIAEKPRAFMKQHVLIIDDISTFGMTMSNIGYDLYNRGASLVSGFTYFSKR